MNMIKNFSNLNKIEQRTFYYLCGASFFMSMSTALENIFFALAILGMIHRLFFKSDDVKLIVYKYRKIFYTILILMAAVLVSAFNSGFITAGLKAFLNDYIFHILVIFPLFVIPKAKNKIITLFAFMIFGIFITNFLVVVEALQNISKDVWRFGGILKVMIQGSLIAMFLPVYIVLAMHIKNIRLKAIFIFVSVIGFLALIFNGTRGVWLAMLILLPAVVLIYSRKKIQSLVIVILSLVLVSGIFLATPNLSARFATITDMQMQSNSERLLMWKSAWQMFKDNPIFGIGYGQYKDAYQTKYISPKAKERDLEHAHSNIMQMLAACGIVGLVAFLYMWGYFSYYSLRRWFKDKTIEWLLFFCVLSGMMLNGLTEFNFETAILGKFFWYSLGLCIAYSNLNSTQKLNSSGNNF